jgi:VCBS repeat-containing protein
MKTDKRKSKHLLLFVLAGVLFLFFTSGVSIATATVDCLEDSLILQDQILVSGQVEDLSAKFSIVVGPSYEIQPGGTLNLTSESISLLPGLNAQEGSTVNINSIAWSDASQPPLAVADAVSVDEGGTISGNVTDNDTDPDCDPFTAQLATTVTHGQFEDPENPLDPNGSFTYIHDGTETITDSFTYLVTDGKSSSTVTVTININPVNDPPVAVDDIFSVDTNTTETPLQVLTNDIEVDLGDSLIIVSHTDPVNGSLTNSTTSLLYAPATNFMGMDTFTYTAQDTSGVSSSANVTVYVGNNPPDDPADQAVVTDEFTPITIILEGADADNDPLTYLITIEPTSGTLSGTPPNVTYTPYVVPSGQDSFTYSVSDHMYTNSAKVTITVNSVEKASIATYDYDALGRITGKQERVVPVKDLNNNGVPDYIDDIFGSGQ